MLNLKLEADARKMRAIAEEAFAMVREYKGSHSGEHGDGLVRSEFHEAMFGGAMVRAFERVKDLFDPQGRFNPGKIVRAPRMDERTLFRFPPGYAPLPLEAALDWSAWGGFAGAAEMCNNNGACRELAAGVMCPSFRATREEKDLTRGRANTLRLALSGQLGPDALTSDAMAETMKLCVGCKACRRECPAGVDMARMKIEVQHHHARRHGLRLHERLVALLPSYAPLAARVGPLLNLRDRLPGAAALSERLTGFSARRPLPAWRSDPFPNRQRVAGPPEGPEVVLFADTFNRWFERETVDDALAVLVAAGYRVHLPGALDGRRPLCCGRTFLSVGLVDEARREARRVLDALGAFVRRGVPVVGLEPSCLFTLRDEYLGVLPGEETRALADQALLFEEFLSSESAEGRLRLPLHPLDAPRALVPRPLSPKGIRRLRSNPRRAAPGAGTLGRSGRVELLRHGRRLRLRRRDLRRVHEDGGAIPPALGAQRLGRHPHRRRRHLLPAADPRRRGPRRGARGPSAAPDPAPGGAGARYSVSAGRLTRLSGARRP